MQTDSRRKVGRPPLQQKKGKAAAWKPAGKLAKLEVPASHVPRWCSIDEGNLYKKQEEGWEFVNSVTYPQGKQVENEAPDRVTDGNTLGSAVKYKDMVGMMLPIEDENGTGLCKLNRDAYHDEENRRQVSSRVALKEDTQTSTDGRKFARQFTPSLTIE